MGEAAASPEEGLTTAAAVLRELWIAPPLDHGLERLDEVCAEWALTVRQRQASLRPPFDPALVALGARLLEHLPRSA